MGDDRGGAARLLDDTGVGTGLDALYDRAIACDGDATRSLRFALDLGSTAPLPGAGSTIDLWDQLATVAAADPTVARIVEPHLDAIAIIAELDEPIVFDSIRAGSGSTWGVFAAEAPDVRLTATEHGDLWRLSGTKPWCSLADRLTHALVTAHVGDGERRLFAVRLGDDGVTVRDGVWVARGLAGVPSGPVDFENVPALPIGATGWYLARPGFAWGGLGVAAIWWGASVGIARLLDQRARSREPDQIALMHLGAVDVALWSARAALIFAASALDGGLVGRQEAGLLANRTRTVVADAAEKVLSRVAHALGPEPLALDERHARRVADLELYLRQHHAERDEVAIGRSVLAGGAAW